MAYRNKEHRSARLSRIQSRKNHIPKLTTQDKCIIDVPQYLASELKKNGAVSQATDSDATSRQALLDF